MPISADALLSRDLREDLAADPTLGAGNLLRRAVEVNPRADAPFITSGRPVVDTDGRERTEFSLLDIDRLTGGKLVNAGLRCPIRGAHFDSEDEALAAATRLREAGVLILPAFFPTVAKGTGLIRFALSTLHDQDQLELAATALEGNHQKAPRRRLETRYA